MLCRFISWVKPLGDYVYRCGKRYFARPTNTAKCRQLRYLRRLRVEPLGPEQADPEGFAGDFL